MIKFTGWPGIFLLPIFFSYSNVSAQAKNYIRYHQLINQAEMHIVLNEFSKAIPFYDTIYHEYDFIFARDCYYATQASVLAGDTSLAFLYLRKCFKQGIRKADIEAAPIIDDLRIYPQWALVMLEYDSLHKMYLGKINVSLRKRIIPIYETEQYYNELSDNATGAKYLPLLLKYKRKNKIYTDSIINIIRSIGHFPGEQEIGIIDSSMYVFDSLTQNYFNPLKGRPYVHTHEYIIIAHYYQMWGTVNYDSLLFKSIANGYLRPQDFAFISDQRSSKKKKNFYTPFVKMYKIFNNKSVPEKKRNYYHDLLNRNRAGIGCSSLEQERLWRERIKWIRGEWKNKNYRIIALD